MTIVEPSMSDPAASSASTIGLSRAAGQEEISGSVAYFAPDSTDSAVIKRALSFRDIGLGVIGLSFRRRRFNADYEPEWSNITLAEIDDASYLKRLAKIFRAVWTVFAQRRRLAEADFYYARNLDMALLALFGRWAAGSPAPLVYEVLDVRPAFLGQSMPARLLRWIERRVLSKACRLVVSSPGFIRHYFEPYQRYAGPWTLLENKLFPFDRLRALTPAAEAARAQPLPPADGRWVIGWFGTLRCAESLKILTSVAEALSDKVTLYVRGYPKRVGVENFARMVEEHDNLIYDGEYRAPDDLAEMYSKVHFCWSVDLADPSGNSHWLIPNRIYEGGFFAVPSLALSQTETGEKVTQLGMGWLLDRPYAESLVNLLEALTWEDYLACRDALAALPIGEFCDQGDLAELCRQVLSLGNRGPEPRDGPDR